jgi:hypothetical protein
MVSLLFSFLSHYFSASSEHFLRNELSQVFALIPGGHMERFRMTAAPLISLGSSQILAQGVSLAISFHLHYFFCEKNSNFRSNSQRATCNLQGGAIYVHTGSILEIYDSAFIGNTAGSVSRFCSCYLAVL